MIVSFDSIIFNKSDATFTRKDYLKTFKHISATTASRDLKKGIGLEILTKKGDKKTTVYKVVGM